jgi:DNA-binding response OmpR family regulator
MTEMTGKKILIVEDDMEMAQGLSIRLRANGYSVSTATDGITAISVAQKEAPDLILLDLGLPAGDGFSVMDRLKRTIPLSIVPVVVLTGRDPQGNQQRSMDSGAMAFLQKPVDNDVLLRTIHELLGENGSQTVKEGDGNTMEDDMGLEADTGAQAILTPPKKILIVEDDMDLLRGLSTRLKANGYNTVLATDGVTAVMVARKEMPDVIILDIGLPCGDGFTVMERLNSHSKLHTVPVIVITGRDPLTTRDRAVNSGAHAFLLKPVENAALLAAIRLAVGEPSGLTEQKQPAKQKVRVHGNKILLVDDDKELARALSLRLKASGYRTVVANDGVTAVSTARKEMPDVILLDIGLPAGDGFTVIEWLSSIAELSSIPIVVVTARDPATAKKQALDAGAVGFLQKPVDNDVLLTAIRKALGETDERPMEELSSTKTAQVSGIGVG